MIGRLEKTVIDCPDPRALAESYCNVLGMRINEDIDGCIVIGLGPGLRQLAFQRAADWIPPRWPDRGCRIALRALMSSPDPRPKPEPMSGSGHQIAGDL